MTKPKTRAFVTCTAAALGLTAYIANAGDLDPPAGQVAPTGTTLQQISSQISGQSAQLGALDDIQTALAPNPTGLGSSQLSVFVRVQDVAGTSQSDGYMDYFEVDTAVLDASREVSARGAGSPPGNPSFPCLRIRDSQIDGATIQLLALLAEPDDKFVEVVFATPTGGGGGAAFITRFEISLDAALLKSVEFDGSGDGATISFVPTRRVTYSYIPQTQQGGPGTPVTFCWDVDRARTCN